MATSTRNESRCTTCGKAAGTFTCRGCSKDFCLRHTNEHRQELIKQMNETVVPLHDQLRQSINTTKRSDSHPLMQRINEWEQTSIEKIQQAAKNARNQLSNIINIHTNELKETLEHLAQDLKKARDKDYFFETDLKEWMKKLDTLKRDLLTPLAINIHYDNNTTSFISKIDIGQTVEISDERFEQSFGDIQITNNGTVINHNQRNSYASVRGRREYSFGKHRLRFLIEFLGTYKWVFFGVISKNALVVLNEPTGKTSYGFAGQNAVWCNGNVTKKFSGYTSDFEINDTIELLINCDQRKIHLVNERTRKTYILDVDIAKCPFPWKLIVGLHHAPGERIRILS